MQLIKRCIIFFQINFVFIVNCNGVSFVIFKALNIIAQIKQKTFSFNIEEKKFELKFSKFLISRFYLINLKEENIVGFKLLLEFICILLKSLLIKDLLMLGCFLKASYLLLLNIFFIFQ